MCSVITTNFRSLPAQVSCLDFIAVLPLRCAVSVSYYRLQDFKRFTAIEILLESNALYSGNRPGLHCQGIIRYGVLG